MTFQHFDPEHRMTVNGVGGRRAALVLISGEPDRIFKQRWISERRAVEDGAWLQVTIRLDDELGNGHNTFAITGDVSRRNRSLESGCLHERIAQTFPELAPLLKWHLCSTDGPLHYLANTLYLASDRDYHGLRKGEPMRFQAVAQFSDVPIEHRLDERFAQFLEQVLREETFTLLDVTEKPHNAIEFAARYTFTGYEASWATCPFRTEDQARRWAYALLHCSPLIYRTPTAWSEGKERQLDAAREAAVWPEATDEQLCQEHDALQQDLVDRLPELLEAFLSDMRAAGLYPYANEAISAA